MNHRPSALLVALIIAQLLTFSSNAESAGRKVTRIDRCIIALKNIPPKSRELKNDFKFWTVQTYQSLKKKLQKVSASKSNSADYPHQRNGSYQAHNKYIPNDQNDQAPKLIVSVNDPGAFYFKETSYTHFDARTAFMMNLEQFHPLKSKEDTTGSHYAELADFPTTGVWAPFYLPGNFVPVRWDTDIASLRMNAQGTIEIKIKRNPGIPLRFEIAEREPESREIALSYSSRLKKPLALGDLPREVREFIQSLRHKTEDEIVEEMILWSRRYFTYVHQAGKERSAHDYLHSKNCQCDGDSLVVTSLYRSFFPQIPVRMVSGYPAQSDSHNPGHSVFAMPTTGHMWVEIWDRNTGRWRAHEPQPSDLREQQKQERKNKESRFRPKGSSSSREKNLNDQQKQFLETLNQFRSPKDLEQALKNFLSNPANKESIEKARAQEFLNQMNGLNTLPDTWEEALSGSQSAESMKLLKEMLLELSAHRKLSREETRLLKELESISETGGRGDEPTREQIIEALKQRMPGPLSQELLAQNPHIDDSTIEYLKLVAKVQLLLDFPVRENNSTLNWRPDPKPDRKKTPSLVPFQTDYEKTFIRATEYNPQWIFRDGPVEYDLQRLISDDLTEVRFPEDDNAPPSRTPPLKPEATIPDIVTGIAFDLSGSMEWNKRYIVRNALVHAVFDQTQKVVKAGKANHTVVFVPYDASPHDPTIILTYPEAVSYFSQLINKPYGAKGANDSPAAIVKTLNTFRELKNTKLRHLKSARLLVVTDGLEGLDKETIIKARQELGAEVEVYIQVINIVENNENWKALAEQFRMPGTVGKAKMSYLHIPRSQVEELLNDFVDVDEKLADDGRDLMNLRSMSEKQKQTLNNHLHEVRRSEPRK